MMKIESILRILEEQGVDYAVIGGVAVVLYGYVRFTKDIDLVIDLSEPNVRRFARALSQLKFQPGVPIDPMDMAVEEQRQAWMRDKNVKVITFYNPESPLLQIDVLITKKFADLKKTRKQIGDFTVSVVDYDDLLRMKQETGRPTDLIDIEKLRELKRLSK
ncbi:nucleotidyltransferase [candidate division WOR-3 bacterium]|nr:nucleotidyltransferase [candidate division WOR-3 bacterium]